MSTLFLDTSPIIYLVEQNPHFIEKVKQYLWEAVENDVKLLTSAITLSETLIKPFKLVKHDRIIKFEDTIRTLAEVRSITWDIAKLSAILRTKYPNLKAVDSFQIACAIEANSDGFLTNDRRLRFIKEIPIILIKDL